jgi:hypothetical protein
MRYRKSTAVIALAVAFGACQDLDVSNLNSPDESRAITSAEDIQSLIKSSFFSFFDGMEGDCYPSWGLGVAADEGTSSWGNCGMQDISSEPRTPFPNTTAYGYRGVVQTPWYDMYDIISSVNDGLRAINEGLEIGEGGEDNARAVAFGKFTQGLAHGFLALEFDRAFRYTEDMLLESTDFQLEEYGAIMDAAIEMFDAAIATAQSNSFTIPDDWMNGESYSNTEFVRIINSHAARYIASVARTPAERAAVNWQEVINRIDAGITEDFGVTLDDQTWESLFKERYSNSTWFRLDNNLLGPADQSGNYQAWLATPVADRQPFDIDTPDRRIMGDAVGTHGTDVYYRAPQNFRADRGTYHFSRYYHRRYEYVRLTQLGFNPMLTVSEMDLLKAEAYIRLGQPELAVPLINKTRVARGQLPPVTVDGVSGADCVPRTATGACGDLWAALRYEKRLEGIAVAVGVAYFDARGWGILIEGTPYHLPIPAVELETLQMPAYTFGGVGGEGAATGN